MTARLCKLHIRNYRLLADVNFELQDVSIFFGPNGSGKSSILDALCFIQDCVDRGTEEATSLRGNGVGLLHDHAPLDQQYIMVELDTDQIQYGLKMYLQSGRVGYRPAERVLRIADKKTLMIRQSGQDSADVPASDAAPLSKMAVRGSSRLAILPYVDMHEDVVTAELVELLGNVRFWHARSMSLFDLKNKGSNSWTDDRLHPRADNLWSVLRNLSLKQHVDDRWSTIISFMRKAFPNFQDLVLDQLGPNSVYAHFLEKGRKESTQASGASDGHMQLLCQLTALFSEGSQKPAVLMFDEPETSLHPWAIAIFAEAVKLASTKWNKQVMIATHSPVLMSQFEPHQCFATSISEGHTKIESIAQIDGIQDLLDQYATGSLYMSEVIGGQSAAAVAESLQ